MKKQRNVYLKMKTLAEAREIILTQFKSLASLATPHYAFGVDARKLTIGIPKEVHEN